MGARTEHVVDEWSRVRKDRMQGWKERDPDIVPEAPERQYSHVTNVAFEINGEDKMYALNTTIV